MPCGPLHPGFARPAWIMAVAVTLGLSACAGGPQTAMSPAPSIAPAPAAVQPAITQAALPCVSLDQFKDTWTPEDGFNRMQDCIAKGDTARASDLDTMAVIYGNYDTWRVSDAEVKNGFTVLTYLTYQNLSDSQRHDLAVTSSQKAAPGSVSKKALCQKITQIGPPAYIPLYMTKYRVDDQGRSMVTAPAEHVDQSQDFDIARQWQQAVDAVLHCSKH